MDVVNTFPEAIAYINLALDIFQPLLLNLYMVATFHAVFIGLMLHT